MVMRLLRETSRRHRVKERVDRALGVVKAFSVAVPSVVQVKLDVDAASGIADSGDIEQDLTDLLVEMGEVMQSAQTGALFLLDEMHNLDTPSLAAICIAFQAISRRGLPVALVGAGLPDLQVRLMAAKPYADRLFAYRELGRLTDASARAALVGPAAALGVRYEEDAVREVVKQAAGYPYFLQEYGLELWNQAEQSPIAMDDVDAAQEIVRESLTASFFGPRMEMATDAEQRYLAAMATLGTLPCRTSDVAERFGTTDQRGVSVYRNGLIRKGLIWSPRRVQVDFTVPLFAEFLREHHPLATFET
jgi:hypothetical protein